jgi:nitrite reductase/ring-hydroxylating ferredoxin subunit
MLGYSIALTSAYLGGHLVFNNQVGVDHTADTEGYPKDFVAVLAEADLAEGTMKRVEANAVPVLLAKKHGRIFAIQENCAHMGGPLAEGELLDDCSVRCPWHGSRYSLEDGSVLDGPSAYPQPAFEVRVRDGQIEVRKTHIEP